MQEIDDKTLRKNIEVFGAPRHLDQALEESISFSLVLQKFIQHRNSSGLHMMERNIDIIDGLAKMKILIRQLELLMNEEESVARRMRFQMAKLSGMLQYELKYHKSL